jgi:hypothetical protein
LLSCFSYYGHNGDKGKHLEIKQEADGNRYEYIALFNCVAENAERMEPENRI